MFVGLLVDTIVLVMDTVVLFVDAPMLFVDTKCLGEGDIYQISPFESHPPLKTDQTNPHARILTFDTCFLDILDQQSDILKPH